MQRIKVSVLTPIYNHDILYVRECLKSLKAQTLRDAEFILIDNEATGASKKIIEEFANSDERFKVVRIDKNKGYGYAMNIGLKEAKGEYIGIVESDDIVHEDMFSDLYNMASYHNADICKCLFKKFENDEVRLEENPSISFPSNMYFKNLKPQDIPEFCTVYGSYWSAIYKKSLLTDNDINYDVMPRPSAEDIMFMLKTYSVAESIVLIDNVYYYHRMDNANSSIRRVNQIIWDCLALYKKLDNYKKLKKDKIPQNIINVLDYREYLNLFNNIYNKKFTHNRLKYILEISKRFRKINAEKNKNFDLTEKENLLRIANHPWLYYFYYLIVKKRCFNEEQITDILGGLFSIREKSKVREIYFLFIKIHESIIKNPTQVSKPKPPYDGFLFKRAYVAWEKGVDENNLKEYEILKDNYTYWEKTNSKLWLVFLSRLINDNKTEDAKRLLRRYIDRIGYKDIHNFLQVADFAYNEKYYTPDIERASFVYNALSRNFDNKIFENYVKNNKIVIVMNGRSKKDKQKSLDIDNNEVVIRFNNYPVGSDCEDKTNIWIHGKGLSWGDINDNRDISKYDLVVWDYDIRRSEIKYNHLEVLYKWLKKYPDKITVLPNMYNNELSDKYDIITPSCEAAAICSVAKIKDFKDIKIYKSSLLEENSKYDIVSLNSDCDVRNEIIMFKDICGLLKV